jgi:hypothetical protein
MSLVYDWSCAVFGFTRWVNVAKLGESKVLLARGPSVGLPIGVMRGFRCFSPGVIAILTWSGLRGGISRADAKLKSMRIEDS